jgi:hypothetical protein
MGLWDAVEAGSEQTLEAHVGPLTVWVRRRGDELHLAFDRCAAEDAHMRRRTLSPAEAPAPEDADWIRWHAPDGPQRIRLLPALPDRSILARPEHAIHLPANGEMLLRVPTPVWLEAAAPDADALTLAETPVTALSNTWFGEPSAGELCYAVHLGDYALPAEQMPAHVALCPVRVTNASDRPVAIERLCVHTPYLSIFTDGERLCANESLMRFEGPQQNLRTTYASGQSVVPEADTLLREPRSERPVSLVRRGLGGVRGWIGM